MMFVNKHILFVVQQTKWRCKLFMNKNETASAKAESAAKTAERDKQTIRLLQWIRRNPVWWMLICTPDDKQMTLEKMKMIIQRLAKDQLYELIFVLLTVHRDKNYMYNVWRALLVEMALAGWSGEVKTKEQILYKLTDMLT